MPEIFNSQVDFMSLLHDVMRKGWAFEPDCLTLSFCRELAAISQSLQFERFSKHTQTIDVETESRIFICAEEAMPRPIGLLHEKLTQRVRSVRSPKLLHFRPWLPNEVTVQRFTEPVDQVSRHQDFGHDRVLVAIFTISGSGPFSLYHSRSDELPYEVCETATGSMALLWAPGLEENGLVDSRPVHSADPAYILPRTTIAFRMTVGKPC